MVWSTSIVDLWIKRGGDVNIANKKLGSLLHSANYWSESYPDMIAYLLKKGIPIVEEIL